jgi:hypothetical protein
VKYSSSDAIRTIPTLDFKTKGKSTKISKTFLMSELEQTGFTHLAEVTPPNPRGFGLLPHFNAVPHGGLPLMENVKDFTNTPFVG